MKVLLAVSGSISAYKSLDIARGLVNNGHQVRVLLTRGALEFVRPQVFRYLGAQDVYTPEADFAYPNSKSDVGTVLHVELTKWADRLAIVPLSANTLSKLGNGEAADLLTSVFLAWNPAKPVLLFPAMNTNMLAHPFTAQNLQRLDALPHVFIHPTAGGKLACGDYGDGKLPTVEKVLEAVECANPALKNASAKKIVITTGATLSPLDPVRYLTNSSSGLTGVYLAREALRRGHPVHLIAGVDATGKLDLLELLPGVSIERVTTPTQMLEAAVRSLQGAHAYVSAAAVGDFEFDVQDKKVKKAQLGDSIAIKKAPDVLEQILKGKRPEQMVVGFAAETKLTDEVLLEKWKKKPVSLLVGTQVHNGLSGGNQALGFGTEGAHYRFLKDGRFSFEGDLSKAQMASQVLDHLQHG